MRTFCNCLQAIKQENAQTPKWENTSLYSLETAPLINFNIFTACKWSCGKVMFSQVFVRPLRGMMSLPVWPYGPMFLPGGGGSASGERGLPLVWSASRRSASRGLNQEDLPPRGLPLEWSASGWSAELGPGGSAFRGICLKRVCFQGSASRRSRGDLPQGEYAFGGLTNPPDTDI